MGGFALAICAYLAAVYLANETGGELREDFRRRALWAGTAVVAMSALMLPLLYAQAPHLWRGLLSARAAPVLAVGVAAALLCGWALWRSRPRLARAATVAQTACLLAGWGIAQHPYLIYPDVTVHAAAAGGRHAALRAVDHALRHGAAGALALVALPRVQGPGDGTDACGRAARAVALRREAGRMRRRRRFGQIVTFWSRTRMFTKRHGIASGPPYLSSTYLRPLK